MKKYPSFDTSFMWGKPGRYQVPQPQQFNDTMTQLQKMNTLDSHMHYLDRKMYETIMHVDTVASVTEQNIEDINQSFDEFKQETTDNIETFEYNMREFYMPASVDVILTEWTNDGRFQDIIEGSVFKDFEKKLNDTNLNSDNFDDINETLKLQKALDALEDGQTLLITPNIYNVVKNDSLTGYPENDQPCLVLRNKKNVKIIANGVTLKTSTHAQGILEIVNCDNVTIEGLKLEGSGLFVPLDGVTGRGEKGYSTGGYNTASFWGFKKNNSYDTSQMLKNGQPWGMFNNGFIGNIGNGLLILNSTNITVDKCSAKGFNYSGFAVGYWGYALEDSYCTNIRFKQCVSTDNYNSNFYIVDGEDIVMEQCVSERAGHYDAKPLTDTNVDPGYGVMVTAIKDRVPNQIVIQNSIFKDCMRKGIDVHSGENIHILDNEVVNCYVSGIFAAYSSLDQYVKQIYIERNKVVKSGIRQLGAIHVSGLVDDNYSENGIILDSKILNNTIIDFGYRGILVNTFNGLIIEGNTIDGHDSRMTGTPVAMVIGKLQLNQKSKNGLIKNNIIKGDIATGVYLGDIESSSVSGNLIELKSSIESSCIYTSLVSDINIHDNVLSIENGRGLNVANSTGLVYNNEIVNETVLSIVSSKTVLGKREKIAIVGGANASMSKIIDNSIVSTLTNVSTDTGFLLTLSNVPTNIIPKVTITNGTTVLNDGVDYVVITQITQLTNTQLRIKLTTATGTNKALNSLSNGSLYVEIEV